MSTMRYVMDTEMVLVSVVLSTVNRPYPEIGSRSSMSQRRLLTLVFPLWSAVVRHSAALPSFLKLVLR